MFLVPFLIQKLVCYYQDVYNTTKVLPNNFLTNGIELSLTNNYFYNSENFSYVISFKETPRNKNKLYVLVLPVSKENMRNDRIDLETKAELRKTFTLDNNSLSKTIYLAKIKLKENEYLHFCALEGTEIAIKLVDQKLYLYSNCNVVQLNEFRTIFEGITFGTNFYTKIVSFNNILLSITAKTAYISYKDKETDERIVRSFFVESRIAWTETVTFKKKVYLKRIPTFTYNRIRWNKTEQEKDEFAARVAQHTVFFVFAFKNNLEEEPKIYMENKETISVPNQLAKMTVVSMNVKKFVLESAERLRTIVPNFFYEKNVFAKFLSFVVFVDRTYRSGKETEVVFDTKLVFYPLDKSSHSFTFELNNVGSFVLTITKVFKNDCLVFEVDVQLPVAKVEKVELPLFANTDQSPLQNLCTYLTLLPGKEFNGMLVGSEPEMKIEEKETDLKPKTYLDTFNRNKVLFSILTLFCLVVSAMLVWQVKKPYRQKKQKRFKKSYK